MARDDRIGILSHQKVHLRVVAIRRRGEAISSPVSGTNEGIARPLADALRA